MMQRRSGFSLIELLVALLIFGIIMGVVGSFMAVQTRASGLAQATNEAELTARTIAEAFAQDMQLAGSRAVFLGGKVQYEDIGDCDEDSRVDCVVSRDFDATGTIVSPTVDVNGYTVFYRTSTSPAAPCRRVDFAHIGDVLYRSDIPCGDLFGGIDLIDAAFATNVAEFAVRFDCAAGSSSGNLVSLVSGEPSACYSTTDDYIRQVTVRVDVELDGRFPVTSGMEMTALTPNLRPSVNYGRSEEE